MRAVFIFLIGMPICAALVGCGFRPRSSNDIPIYLRTLYLDSPNSYDPIVVQLSRSFQSLNIHLTRMKESAPITLRIFNIKWEPLIPAILYSNAVASYAYLLSISFDLETHNKRILIGPKNLILRRQLIQNPNQIYTPNATQLMRQEMIRTIVSLIYKELVIYKSSC